MATGCASVGGYGNGTDLAAASATPSSVVATGGTAGQRARGFIGAVGVVVSMVGFVVGFFGL